MSEAEKFFSLDQKISAVELPLAFRYLAAIHDRFMKDAWQYAAEEQKRPLEELSSALQSVDMAPAIATIDAVLKSLFDDESD